jgi:N-glycosylase/DNA lyase
MPIVQCNTINGNFIDEARWNVSTLQNLREGQNLQVSLPASNQRLVEYVANLNKMECSVERDRKSKKCTLTFTVKIVGFRHMLEPPKKAIESMAVVVPVNRTVENVLLYLLGSDLIDSRFKAAVNAK